LAVFVFTRSLTAAVIVVMAVTTIVVYVTAMMSAFFKWSLGPVEVVSIIVFLGYCVTYCIHIAHAYTDLKDLEHDSQLRVRMALLRLGPATVSSAVTTMCTCVFLCLCTITIFVKFGVVLFLTTFLGLCAAIGALPPFLAIFGELHCRCAKAAHEPQDEDDAVDEREPLSGRYPDPADDFATREEVGPSTPNSLAPSGAGALANSPEKRGRRLSPGGRSPSPQRPKNSEPTSPATPGPTVVEAATRGGPAREEEASAAATAAAAQAGGPLSPTFPPRPQSGASQTSRKAQQSPPRGTGSLPEPRGTDGAPMPSSPLPRAKGTRPSS